MLQTQHICIERNNMIKLLNAAYVESHIFEIELKCILYSIEFKINYHTGYSV